MADAEEANAAQDETTPPTTAPEPTPADATRQASPRTPSAAAPTATANGLVQTPNGGFAPAPSSATAGGEGNPGFIMGQRVYENTYRMKPEVKFQSEKTRKIIDEVLHTKLKGVTYSPEKASTLAKEIGDEILRSVRKLDFDRYKFIVDVGIAEFKGQGLRVASRSLWDATTDSHASFSFHNATLTCCAIVFGCFVE